MRVAPAEWAVLVYSSASPDIEAAAVAALEEVARAAQPDSVVIGAQLGTASGASRYVFTGSSVDEMSAPAPVEAPDMSSPGALEDFLRWGMRAFPAKRYAVVVGGHGAGFLGAVTDPARRKMMRPDEMADALAASGLRPQVLVLNACLMAQAEVAAEFAPHADFLVASQGLEHAEGMPLGRFVERLSSARDGEEAARALVGECSEVPSRTPRTSAVDLRAMGGVVGAMDHLGKAVLSRPDLAAAVGGHLRALPDYRERPGDRPLTDQKDLALLCARLQQDPALLGSEIAEAAEALAEALRGAVVEGGLSAYMPAEPMPMRMVDEIYQRLDLPRRTAWDEAMGLIASG